MENIKEYAQVIQWVYWYLYNVSPMAVVDEVFKGDSHMNYYLREKAIKLAEGGKMKWYMEELDLAHRNRVIELAIKKYKK